MLVLGAFCAIAIASTASTASTAAPARTATVRASTEHPLAGDAGGAAAGTGAPIPWTELSGLAGDPVDPDLLWAVGHDSLAAAVVYALDASTEPATVVGRIVVTDDGVPRSDLDLRGIALVGRRGAWVVSGARPPAAARLLRIDEHGNVIDEVELPDGSGPPGALPTAVAVDGAGRTEVVYVGFGQSERGASTTERIGRWHPTERTWSFVGYSTDTSSRITRGIDDFAPVGDGTFLTLERPDAHGVDPGRVYRIDLRFAEFVPADLLAGASPLAKDLVVDLRPASGAASVWTPAPVTGLAVTSGGRLHVAIDRGAGDAGAADAARPADRTVVVDLDLETLLISTGAISTGTPVSERDGRGASRRRS